MAGFRPNEAMTAFSSGCMGARTATRLGRCCHRPIMTDGSLALLACEERRAMPSAEQVVRDFCAAAEHAGSRGVAHLLLGRRRVPQHPDGAG